MKTVNIKNFYDTYHDDNAQSARLKVKFKPSIDNLRYCKVLNMMNVEKGERILDVGCGKGALLAEAEKRGLICHGIDISETALKTAKKMTDAYYICSDVEHGILYPNEYFDYVTCLGVWEHFTDQEAVLRQMVSALKKSGRMCIFVPNKNYILHKFGYETDNQPIVNRHSLAGYIGIFKKSGLVIEKILKDNSHLSNLRESTGYLKYFIKLLVHPYLNFLPMRLSYHFMFICRRGNTS